MKPAPIVFLIVGSLVLLVVAWQLDQTRGLQGASFGLLSSLLSASGMVGVVFGLYRVPANYRVLSAILGFVLIKSPLLFAYFVFARPSSSETQICFIFAVILVYSAVIWLASIQR